MTSKDSVFLARAEAANTAYKYKGCGVGALVRGLKGSLKADVEEALYNRPDLTHSAIHTALKSYVEDAPSAFTIGRHRRGICSCHREDEAA